MKKIFIIIFAVVLILPALNVEAAYVIIPDFVNMDRNNIEFAGKEQKNGITALEFNILNGEGKRYAFDYTFKLIGRGDFQPTSEGYPENHQWNLSYKGTHSKNMKAMSDLGNHILIAGDDSWVVMFFVDEIEMINYE